MAVLLEKVMFDLPQVVESQSISQLGLIESVFKQTVFVSLAPRAGDLMLIEQSKLHDWDPMGRRWVTSCWRIGPLSGAWTLGLPYGDHWFG